MIYLQYLFLFPRIKKTLKGTQNGTLEEVTVATTITMQETPVVDFQGALNDLVKYWQWNIETQGQYFEKTINFY